MMVENNETKNKFNKCTIFLSSRASVSVQTLDSKLDCLVHILMTPVKTFLCLLSGSEWVTNMLGERTRDGGWCPGDSGYWNCSV